MPKANSTVVSLIREYVDLDQAAKQASSALNKKTTELRNAVKKDFEENAAPFGSYYIVDGVRISYEASVSDGIAPADLLEQYEQGDITRDQLLACITVGMDATKNTLGGDVVEALKQPITGKTVDIRRKVLPVEEHIKIPTLFVIGQANVKRRRIGAKGTLTDRPEGKSETSGKARVPRRKIKVRK